MIWIIWDYLTSPLTSHHPVTRWHQDRGLRLIRSAGLSGPESLASGIRIDTFAGGDGGWGDGYVVMGGETFVLKEVELLRSWHLAEGKQEFSLGLHLSCRTCDVCFQGISFCTRGLSREALIHEAPAEVESFAKKCCCLGMLQATAQCGHQAVAGCYICWMRVSPGWYVENFRCSPESYWFRQHINIFFGMFGILMVWKRIPPRSVSWDHTATPSPDPRAPLV